MITIKRNCASSIRDNSLKDKITFGNFTIVIEGYDYMTFVWLKNEVEITPDGLLDEIIRVGLKCLFEEYGGTNL